MTLISAKLPLGSASRLVSAGELLAGKSDFVSLHTALSPATQNLINANTLAQMKKGARLITLLAAN